MKRFRSLKLRRRVVMVALAAIAASLLAAGCGSSSGNGGKATSAKGLDLVPSNSLLYLVADTNFDGSSWQQFDKLAKNFTGYDAGKKDLLKQLNKGDSSSVTWADIKPWLGDEAGVAVISTKAAGSKDQVFAWVDVKDTSKAEKTITKGDTVTDTGKVAGSQIKKDAGKGSPTYYAFTGKILVFSDTRSVVAKALKTGDGSTSISDSSGIKSVAGHVDSKAIASLVVNGPQLTKVVRAAVAKDPKAASLSGLTKSKALDAMQGLALSLVPEDKGFHLAGYVGFDKGKLGSTKVNRDDFTPKLFESLPADTALALGGNDLGGSIQGLVGQLETAQPSIKTQLTQLESVVGLKVGDIAKALGGQYAIGVHGSAGTPGVSAIFEAKDEAFTATTMGKLFSAIGTLTGGANKQGTTGGVATNSVTVAGQTIYESTAKGTSIVTLSPTATDAIRNATSTLGSSDAYKRVTGEAGMPGKVGGVLWLDVQQVLGLAKSTGLGAAAGSAGTAAAANAGALGPMLGWLGSGDDHISLDLFAEVDKNAQANATAAAGK